MQLDKFALMYQELNSADAVLSPDDDCDNFLREINKTTNCHKAIDIAFKTMGKIEKEQTNNGIEESRTLDSKIYINRVKKEISFEINDDNTCFELTVKQGEKESENKELLFYRKWQIK